MIGDLERRPVEAAGPVENAPPRTPNRVSHRPLDGACGSVHSYHGRYDYKEKKLRR